MYWLLIFAIFCPAHLALNNQDNVSSRKRRSAGFTSFEQLMRDKPDQIPLTDTNCVLKKNRDTRCQLHYKVSRGCSLAAALEDLTPGADFLSFTDNFIDPQNFVIKKLKLQPCKPNASLALKAKSTGHVELVPQLLSMQNRADLALKWKPNEAVTKDILKIKIKGFSTIGSARVKAVLEKDNGTDYDLKLTMKNFKMNDLFAAFHIDTESMIGTDLIREKRELQLSAIEFRNAKINGVFSPGNGFEIVATGTVPAPYLASAASKFFMFIQNFKKGDSQAEHTEFAQPVGGIFALYEGKTVPEVMTSLTGIELPGLALFNDRGTKVLIKAASSDIFNINSGELNKLAAEFIPMKGMDMIMKGLSVSHFARTTNQDIKDTQDRPVTKIMYTCKLTPEKIIWDAPYDIESELGKYTHMVWSESKGSENLRMPLNTKSTFVSVEFLKGSGAVELNLNLTQPVPVLQNGLVYLLNTTITLYTERRSGGGEYNNWKMRGTGRESILDSMVDLTVEQTENRTTVSANAEIFSMETLRNRTRAESLPEELRETLPYVQTFAIKNLRFEASFESNSVLRCKGQPLVDEKLGQNPELEILYFITENGPQLKVGWIFKGVYLYEVANMFYGKKFMEESWLKFKTIALVAKQKAEEVLYQFDSELLKEVEEYDNSGVVQVIADEFDLNDCHGEKSRTCSFFQSHFGGSMAVKYVGGLTKTNGIIGTPNSYSSYFFPIDSENKFELKLGVSYMTFNNKTGVRFTFEARAKYRGQEFRAEIYDYGANVGLLRLRGEEHEPRILSLNYAILNPIRANIKLPTSRRASQFEFRSRLLLGLVHGKRISLSGSTGRQFISSLNDPPRVRFIGEKTNFALGRIWEAFGVSNSNEMLNEAIFKDQMVVAYNSDEEVWNAPDFNAKVKKGLHFYGKLTLKSGETYEATINLLDTMQFETRLHLQPLRYGRVINDSEGRTSLQNVNLFLYKSEDRPELGPDRVFTSDTEHMEGYCETVGLAGPFTTEIKNRTTDDFEYGFKIRGKLFDETEETDVLFTAMSVAGVKPEDLKFKYRVDLKEQIGVKLNENLGGLIADIQKAASDGKSKANEIVEETRSLVAGYNEKQEHYNQQMVAIQEQILNINQDIDMSILETSTDCINQCKTVPMPGFEWNVDCMRRRRQRNNMTCMTWTESKEKVVNVICLLKCEARKVSAAGEATQSLRNITVLVNRYRETKILSNSLDKVIELAEEGSRIASSTKTFIDEKAVNDAQLKGILERSTSGNFVRIQDFVAEAEVEKIEPPCLRFLIYYHLNGNPESRVVFHNMIEFPSICFNGEFFDNAGMILLRDAFPKIDDMFKTLSEAERNYNRINTLKKSLNRVMEQVSESSKRSKVPKVKDDLILKNLMKIAKRRIPGFTLKGDKTMLAFSHYSPWATARREEAFSAKLVTTGEGRFNMKALKDKSACQQAKHVVSEYKNIADSIERVSENYGLGKDSFGRSKVSIMKDLDDSRSQLLQQMNRTKLSNFEKTDMMYWYEYTKKGMGDYLETMRRQLAEHNKRGLVFLRDGYSSFYGQRNFVDLFEQLGTNALKRSNIEKVGKEDHEKSLKVIGTELKRMLYTDGHTLENATSVIGAIRGQIESLHTSTMSCY